ncbi:MAG: SLBB domain-containing protein [Verrucomicrobiia bacterium]
MKIFVLNQKPNNQNTQRKMRTTTLNIVGVAIATGLVLISAQAQQADKKATEFVTSIKEWREAEKAVSQTKFKATQLQQEVDRLSKQKTALQRQLEYANLSLESALRSLKIAQAITPPDKEAVDKAQKNVDYYQAQIRQAQADLTKCEQELRQTIEAYRKALQEPLESKLILPGEVLQLFVLEDETFNGLYQVRSGGYIILPRVGRVSVVGKSLEEAQTAIRQALEATQLRQATVLVERSPGIYGEDYADVIYLAGEFKTTGPLKIPAGIKPTLVTTIIRSGGLTENADLTRVKLLRLESGKSLVEEVNVQAIMEGAGLQSDLDLNPGDIIVVPSYAPVVYVTGNVVKPGVIQLSPDEELTAYSAILRCGGFARFAKIRGVYVLRDRGNGEKTRIPVDIKQVQAGKMADVILQGKDIVVVPEKFFSF